MTIEASVRRIAMVSAVQSSSDRCGIKDYAGTLCAELLREGVSCHEVIMPPPYTSRHRLAAIMAIRTRTRQAARRLRGYDLVHVQYADMAWNGARIYEDLYEVFSRECGQKRVITVHEHPWFRGMHGDDAVHTTADRIFALVAGHGLRPGNIALEVLLRHRMIHVHQVWQREELVRHGVPEETIMVLPHPVHKAMASREEIDNFVARFRLDGKRLVSMAGFIVERKRYDLAIRILPHLDPATVLCLLGGSHGRPSERYIERLRAEVERMGLKSRVVFAGYLADRELAAGMAASSVVLAPYGEVSSSGSVARAVGTGTPIVAASNRTFAELAAAGAGVITTDVGNEKVFAGEVTRVLGDAALSEALRARNLEYAGKHSWAVFAANIRRVHERVMNAA